MAASERLYELWLLYYAQVSPSRPWSAGSPDPLTQCLLHLRPAPPRPQIGAHTCVPLAAGLPRAFVPGDSVCG